MKQCKPVMFFKKDGDVFYFHTQLENDPTRYFLVTNIWDNCMELMALQLSITLADRVILVKTDKYITVEKDMFCGYHAIENIMLYPNNHPHIHFYDTFTGSFTISKENPEITIWRSDIAACQSGEIHLTISEPITDSPTAIIYHYDKNIEIALMQTTKIPLKRCRKIKLRVDSDMMITGTFQIHMKSSIYL